MVNLPKQHQLEANRFSSTGLRLCRMLRYGNIRGAAVATLLMLMTAGPTMAQPDLAYPLVDWSDGMRVHREIEAWVGGGVPEKLDHQINVCGASGVQVTLRWIGLTVGRGQWMRDSDDPSEPLDLLDATWQATQSALGAVRNRFEAQKVPDVDESMRNLASLLTVDLQIARTSTLVLVGAAAAPDSVYQKFAAGYHGLILSSPNDPLRRVHLFPADALARNLNPHLQLVSLLSALRMSSNDLVAIGRPGGPTLRRFEVIHLVRPAQGEPVARLTRGNVVLPLEPATMPTLDDMSQRLVAFLVRRQRDYGLMAGTYQPTPDQYSIPNASVREQAVALYAVAHWLKLLRSDRAMTQELLDAQSAVRVGVDRLSRELLIPLADEDVPAAALTLMTMIESPALSDRKELRAALQKLILESQEPTTGLFRDGRGEKATLLKTADQGLPLAAIAKLYDQTRDETLLDPLKMGYQTLAITASDQGETAALPLLLEVADVLRRAGVDIRPPATLGRVVSALLMRQYTVPASVGPADTVGGFDLGANGSPPDWRSAFGLLFLSSTLQYIDSPIRQNWQAGDLKIILSCGLAARFLAQLMFDEPACFYVRSRADVLGGVRKSLWENTLSPEPTAMTLLAVTQLQHALTVWQQSQASPLQDDSLPNE